MSNKLAGKKYAGSHSTVIDAAYEIAREADKFVEIEKISLGIIRQCRAGRGVQNIKIKMIDAGLEMIIRGNSYVQTIYLYLSTNDEPNKKEIALRLERLFYAKGKHLR